MEPPVEFTWLYMLAFCAPSFVGLPIVIILAANVSRPVAISSAGAAYVVFLLYWVAIDTIRVRLMRVLLAGVSLLLAAYFTLVAMRWRAWWVLGAGVVLYAIVMAIGARRADRRSR
jgi:hypothetical protein